uniref:Bifunctional epoxide hydrolase 2-like n=1 Tax=Rhizophora mucronata TaxID=61149 RepID=A0A2P2KQM5_RHIMU
MVQVFLVGKDFAAFPTYLVAVLHPSKVSGVVTLGVPYIPPNSKAVQTHLMPKGFYITRWQEPGWAEADFGWLDVKTVIKNICTLFSISEVPIAGDDQEIMDLRDFLWKILKSMHLCMRSLDFAIRYRFHTGVREKGLE